jgi:glucosamine-6-phosphate deaminase
MEVIIRPTVGAALDLASQLIADDVRKNPAICLGLATGRTMENLYARLGDMHKNAGLDFSRVRTFNLDEYIGLPAESKHSYRYYMNKQLFELVDISMENTYLPDGMADDIEAECADYERKMCEAGGVDLQLLGIGRSGHVGFNEPLSALRSRTRGTTLAPFTIAQNSPLFDHPSEMPKRAITMGVGTILDAKSLLMVVTGDEKADILAKAVEGPVTSMISASAIQYHPDCTVIIDEAAATNLQCSDYYHQIFQTEPKWAPYR